MIKFSATNALVHSVSPVIQVTDNFQKRELILDDSWDKDGKHYSSFVSVEFTGDKMDQLDGIYPGQRVNVEGLLSGREYNNRIYNSVRGQSVTPYLPQQQCQAAPMPGGYNQQQQYQAAPGYQAAPMPGGYPQQTAAPAYPQQPQQYAPAPATAPVAAPAQQPYGRQSPGVADLPFPH